MIKRPVISKRSAVYKKPGDKAIRKMVNRARAITNQLDQVKPLYGELDEITFALLAVQKRLKDHGAVIVDRFADKNTAFKTVGIRRYELSWERKFK